MERSNFARACGIRALLLPAIIVLWGPHANAQLLGGPQADSRFQDSTCSIEGHLQVPGATLTSRYTLKLDSLRDHFTVARIQISPGGDFQADGIPVGDYEVQVLDDSGAVVYDGFESFNQFHNTLQIAVDSGQKPQPVTGTVSVQQLGHRVPKKARKEFAKALKASDSGHPMRAIAHLKKAIDIDPAYMEAYNNLGVRYLKLGQWQAAAEEFQKAVELDQNSSPAYSNLCVAMYSMNQMQEAEKAARRAVELDGTNERARLMLGMTLTALRKDDAEALANLRHVDDDFPKAHVMIAQVLARQGHAREAIAELKRYLQSGKAEDPAQVQMWIAQIEKAAPPAE